MFKNHLKIAWRSLKKQPFFTFLNTFGLAIGMAGGILISLYIHDELNYDKMFADAERIYRIDTDIKFGGAEMRFCGGFRSYGGHHATGLFTSRIHCAVSG
ncbi:ABC transporter permease [Maribacter aestuarii]|uniref:ABC transporter permease n=1 Tax=Maribacter aestuarii TaxID=1130723 RepID=UPI003221A4F4